MNPSSFPEFVTAAGDLASPAFIAGVVRAHRVKFGRQGTIDPVQMARALPRPGFWISGLDDARQEDRPLIARLSDWTQGFEAVTGRGTTLALGTRGVEPPETPAYLPAETIGALAGALRGWATTTSMDLIMDHGHLDIDFAPPPLDARIVTSASSAQSLQRHERVRSIPRAVEAWAEEARGWLDGIRQFHIGLRFLSASGHDRARWARDLEAFVRAYAPAPELVR